MQAWSAALIVYMPLRVREYKGETTNRADEIDENKRLALERLLNNGLQPVSLPVEIK
jgi:hypothetical protein